MSTRGQLVGELARYRQVRRRRPRGCGRPREGSSRAHGPSTRGSRARCRSAGDGRAHWRSVKTSERVYDRAVAKAPLRNSELPRNVELAEQFDLLADLMELEGSDPFRLAAYRRAAARIRETGSSVAQLALDGRAKSSRASARRSRRRSSRWSGRRDPCAHEAQGRGAGRGGELPSPAWARSRTAPDLEGARDHHVAGLREAARPSVSATSAGSEQSEERILAALAKPQSTGAPAAPSSARSFRGCGRSPRRSRRIPRRWKSRLRARRGGTVRPSAISI